MATMKPGHPGDLTKLRASPAFAKLVDRFDHLDVYHDIPDGLGSNVKGTTRYIDKDLFMALFDGEVDTGLTPEQTVHCLVEHIDTEKALADDNNGIDHWADISLLAHQAEADKVKSFGGDVDKYDRAIAPLFIACKAKKAKNVPSDLMDLEGNDDELQERKPEGEPSGTPSQSKAKPREGLSDG